MDADTLAEAHEVYGRIWEAYSTEERDRELMYASGEYHVAGVELPAMNGRSYNLLCAIGSPYVLGGNPTYEDACKLIWTIWHAQARKPWWIRIRSIRKQREWLLKRVDKSLLWEDVAGYVDAMFLDAPRGSGGSYDSMASAIAYVVHSLIINYQWTEEYILEKPLPRIYQYMKLIRRYHDPEYKPKPGPKVKAATKNWIRFKNEHKLTDDQIFQRN